MIVCSKLRVLVDALYSSLRRLQHVTEEVCKVFTVIENDLADYNPLSPTGTKFIPES